MWSLCEHEARIWFMFFSGLQRRLFYDKSVQEPFLGSQAGRCCSQCKVVLSHLRADGVAAVTALSQFNFCPKTSLYPVSAQLEKKFQQGERLQSAPLHPPVQRAGVEMEGKRTQRNTGKHAVKCKKICALPHSKKTLHMKLLDTASCSVFFVAPFGEM